MVQLGYGEAAYCLIPQAEATSICSKKARELIPCLLESAKESMTLEGRKSSAGASIDC